MLFTSNKLIGQEIDSIHNHQLSFSSSFSYAAIPNNLMGNIFFKQQFFEFESKNLSLGTGNYYQLNYIYNLDSSEFYLSSEIGVLMGEKNFLTPTQTAMNAQTGMSIETRMWHFAAMIGYKIKLNNPLNFSLASGIIAPLGNTISERFSFQELDYTANVTKTYTTRFFPGFIGHAALNYTHNNRLSLSIFSRLTLLTLQEKNAKITSFYSSENEQISNYFPTVSDQETKYFKDLSSLQNDPIITPNNFDANKPKGALARSLPYNNIAFGIQFLWSF